MAAEIHPTAVVHPGAVLGEGVNAVDFAFVGGKWANPFWQVWDLAMLWLAMLHGANGVRTIINDYVERDGRRLFLKGLLLVTTALVHDEHDALVAEGTFTWSLRRS